MEELLTQLKLARIREVYRDWIDKASREEMSYNVRPSRPLSGIDWGSRIGENTSQRGCWD